MISGATSASLTLAKAPYNISGSQFTVKVSNSSNTLMSQAATLTVNPLLPNLAFAPIGSHRVGDASFPVFASSPSGGAITYSILSGPAVIAGSIVTVTGLGNVSVGAMQAAMGDYSAAVGSTMFAVVENVSVSSITPANQTIGPGQETFTATSLGGLTNGLNWTASEGSFVGNLWTSPNVAGQYLIKATSVDDTTKSASTTITISPPVITRQPASQNACSSGTATLSVGAIYDRTYQWSRNGAALNGATGLTYFISGADGSLDAGAYTVSVSNPAGSVTSNSVTLSVGSQITLNPVSLTVAGTGTATFSTAVVGKSPFTYQWYRIAPGGLNGTPIEGAVSDVYTTPSISGANNGDQYYVVIVDGCGTTLTSTSATLSVNASNVPPTIITQPISQNIPSGGTAIFSVVASGTPTLNYQWYQIPIGSDAGTLIAGATSSSYTLPESATGPRDDQDAYYVTVTNGFGEAASQRAVLTVGAGITIERQPNSVYTDIGDSVTFSVLATSTLPLSYQWYQAAPGTSTFTAIPGADEPTYTLQSAEVSMSSATYYVIISNGVTASVQSDTAALFVGSPSGIDPCASWNLIGDATEIGNCSYRLTESAPFQSGEIVWPTPVSTANLQLSFTVVTSNATYTPADGFAIVLGDPSLGATITSQGLDGEGLGARGIPGVVIAFDDYLNPANSVFDWPQDPQVPYLGVGRSENDLWENPYFNVNTSIPPLADPSGLPVSHDYVVLIARSHVTVTMDGIQVFSGQINIPPVAYLYATSSTGTFWETTTISNISAIASTSLP